MNHRSPVQVEYRNTVAHCTTSPLKDVRNRKEKKTVCSAFLSRHAIFLPPIKSCNHSLRPKGQMPRCDSEMHKKSSVPRCLYKYMSCFLSLFMSYFITIPLPLIVSCCSKIQTGFTFLVPAHLGSPGKGAVKRVCVFHQDTACTAYFHCLRVRLLRVTLNINQSINFLRPARPIRPSRSGIFLQFHRSRPSHPPHSPTDRPETRPRHVIPPLR